MLILLLSTWRAGGSQALAACAGGTWHLIASLVIALLSQVQNIQTGKENRSQADDIIAHGRV